MGRWTSRARRAALWAVVACLAAGCVRVKDTLTLNADGSGTVQIETTYNPADMAMDVRRGGMFGSEGAPYPPLAQYEAEQLFPSGDFTVKVQQKKAEGNEKTAVVTASFKDVNRLLASPYAQAHSLWMEVDDAKKTLTVKALSGLQSLAVLPEVLASEADMQREVAARMKGMKERLEKMSVEFTVKMPDRATAEGAAVDGYSATWSADRAVIKDDAKFAAALRQTYVATCPSGLVKFKPVSPVRLDLWSFADLREGPMGEKPPEVDEAKVRAAAKFTPVSFQATRTFFLADEGYGQGNSATLNGIVTIPAELAPRSWGTVDVTEAVDDQGNSLLLGDKARGYDRGGGYRGSGWMRERKPKEPPKEVRQTISMAMKPPMPAVKSLRRVQASVELRYPGTLSVVKMKDVVAKVEAAGKADAADEVIEVPAEPVKPATEAKPDAFGLKLTVRSASYERGMTNLMVQRTVAPGKSAAIQAIQVFDAKGRAWPTSQRNMGGGDDDENLYVTVAGRPEAPLSLAMIVDGGGAVVKVPIDLRNVPIEPNEPPAADKDKAPAGGALERPRIVTRHVEILD